MLVLAVHEARGEFSIFVRFGESCSTKSAPAWPIKLDQDMFIQTWLLFWVKTFKSSKSIVL